MKKFFAIIALGMMLTCSAFATSQLWSEKYPIYTGSINDPGVKVVEKQGNTVMVEVDGQFYIIILN